jgi:hypothetical protein
MMQGTVQEVSTRDVSTKFGVKPTFSFKVDNQWVKTGFKNPRVSVGDVVSFDGVEGKYGLEGTDVKVNGKAVATPAGLVAGAASSPKGFVPVAASSYSKMFPIPPLHGDRSIVRQNALNRAADLVAAAHGGKAFAMDDDAVTRIIALARKFEAYTAGDLDMEEAVAEAKREDVEGIDI